MKLTFLYHPTTDLGAAAAFHRDQLGLTEAWREGTETIAFWLPERAAQIMISTTAQPAGPMYLVDSVQAWLSAHPQIALLAEPYEIPGGSVVGLTGADGYVFYVFDQPDA